MEKLGVVQLEGARNWSVWRFQMTVILRDQGLYKIVSSPNVKHGGAAETTKTGQASAEPEQASVEKDIKAMSAIVTRLAEPVLHHVITCQTAHEVWSRLHSIYEKNGETSLMLQQQRFFALKFEDDMSVADFISKVQEQQQTLKRLGEAVTDRMAMSKIIMSLPLKYAHFVSAWESCAEEKQTMDNLTARLLVEEERLNNKCSSKAEESVALFSKGQKGTNKGNFKCFLCHKPGHLKKDCKLKNVCFKCNKPGHFKDKCKASKNDKKDKENSDKGNKKTESAFVSTVLVSASDRSIDEKWLVDSGASHHMTYQKELFCEYEKLSTPKVIIGDGRKLNALGIGKVKIMAFDGSVVCNGFHVSMTNDKCVFSKNNRVCAIANKESCSKLYVMDFKSESLQANVAKVKLSEWHERIYFPEKNAVEIVRDVTFVKKHDKPEREEQEEKCIYLDIEENLNNEVYQSESDTEGSVEFEDCQVNDNMMQEVEFLEEEILEHEEIQEVNESMPVNLENTRRTRSRKAPNWFHDYEVGFISVHNEPSTLKEAMECEDKENWIEAMNREITTLKENNTWTEVAMLPKGIKAINNKWVFRIKENPSQEIQYKARLVARGFEQTDMDGAEVYAPVASLTTFRTMLAVAARKKLPVYQMDVTGAFLYGDIDEHF
ncbi:unnamed protein product, partial [Brenthis ino]